MAIFKTPLGQFKNRLGNMVTYTIEGDSIARSLPLNVRNPRTAKQILQRNRFHALVTLSKQLRAICQFGFTPSGKRQSVSNLFIQHNKDIVTIDELGTAVIRYEDLVISSGTLLPVEVSGAWDPETGNLLLTQAAAKLSPNATEKDAMVYAACIETQTMETLLIPMKKINEPGVTTVEIPASWDKSLIRLYALLHDEATRRNSLSKSCQLAPAV